MSGEVWTDYNYSDPGVTIIEQLCYALTELPYRARLPVQDLLSASGQKQLQLRGQGLYPAWSILPCNPVTSADLRRLVIDRVPGVANVWFSPRLPKAGTGIRGLYDVAIMSLEDGSGSRGAETALIERVRRCYTAHRALCEDLNTVRVLRAVVVQVNATIELEDGADASETLAQAYFALGLTLAPEPRRMTLAQQRATDPASTEVFSGPLMLRGFIANGQLGDMPASFKADQLTEVLAEAPGVLTVDTLEVVVPSADGPPYTGSTSIPVPAGGVFRLQTAPSDTGFSITMFRRDSVCDPDAAQVRRKLAGLWRQQRETYPLRTEYAEVYGAPAAQYWDLASYVSVQTQFPVVYGIGGGSPPNQSPQRRGQVKQLKGYLMPFDQMLADYFSQLAFMRELFSGKAGGHSTYAYQSLRPIVPDVGPLLADDYESGLAEITAETDPVNARRGAIFDLLLSFYGLSVAADPQSVDDPRAIERQRVALVRTKQMLLRRAALATRDRGRGVDYLRRSSERRMAGAELLARIKLGLLDAESEDFQSDPTAPDGPGGSSRSGFARVLPRDVWPVVDRYFRSVGSDGDELDTGSPGQTPPASAISLDENGLADLLRGGLDDTTRYRIGELGETKGVCLAFGDREGRWWLIGLFASEGLAMAALRGTVRAARRYLERGHEHQLYMVEWILLRYAMAADAAGGNFDFRVSAVLSTTKEERDSAGWRTQATTILRDCTPAHVALDCLFLGPRQMHHFRRLYGAWTQALRNGPAHARAEASRHLAWFLVRHGSAEPGDGTQDPPTAPAPPPPPPSGGTMPAHLARLAAALGGTTNGAAAFAGAAPTAPDPGTAAGSTALDATAAPSAKGARETPPVFARPDTPAFDTPSPAPSPPAVTADPEDRRSVWQRRFDNRVRATPTPAQTPEPPAPATAPAPAPKPSLLQRLFGHGKSTAPAPTQATPAPATYPPPAAASAPAPTPKPSLWQRLFGHGKSTAPAPTQATPAPATSPIPATATAPAPTPKPSLWQRLFGHGKSAARAPAPTTQPSAAATAAAPSIIPAPTAAFAPTTASPAAAPAPATVPAPAPKRSFWQRLFGKGKTMSSTSTPTSPSPSAVQTIAPGAVGFDCDTVLTASSAASFLAQGFTFAIRYLSRTTPEASGDLSAQEVTTILSAGLGLMAVQHVAPAGWTPSQSLGTQYGQAAATNAAAVGLPEQMCLWLDLEGVATGVSASVISSYCTAWFTAVSSAGYLPGLYVGANCGLSGQQLSALKCAYYWQSGSEVPTLSGTGYCMVQTINASYSIAGVAYDRDVVQSSGTQAPPVMAAPTASPPALQS